ncbi:MAG: hypothetical protein R3C27_14965 [Hyphomonadaceae bacterium]
MPQADGSYAITGQKDFHHLGRARSCAEHRSPARAYRRRANGIEGHLAFIVPKFRDADSSRNAVQCDGVEEKMGVTPRRHARSPTKARLALIGEQNRGLHAMFTMMNAARLNVGMEGVAVAEAAYRNARLREGAQAGRRADYQTPRRAAYAADDEGQRSKPRAQSATPPPSPPIAATKPAKIC